MTNSSVKTLKNSSINPLMCVNEEPFQATIFEDEQDTGDIFPAKTTLTTSTSLGGSQWSKDNPLLPMPPLKTSSSTSALRSTNLPSTFGSAENLSTSNRSDPLNASDRSNGNPSSSSFSPRGPRRKLSKRPDSVSVLDGSTLSLVSPGNPRRKLSKGRGNVSYKRDRSQELSQVLLQQTDSVRINKNVESLTINKLNYDLGVIGRHKEIGEMKACLRRLVLLNQSTGFSAMSFSQLTECMIEEEEEASQVNNTFKELIWLKGYSGAGKSTLVNSLEKSVTNNPRGILVQGKFDIKGSDQPYSGILHAFGQIFAKLSDGTGGRGSARVSLRSSIVAQRSGGRSPKARAKKERGLLSRKDLRSMRQEIADGLKMELGDELNLLVKMVPFLANVVGRRPPGDKNGSSTSLMSSRNFGEGSDERKVNLGDGYGAGQERIKFAFRILMRVVSSYFSPLVMVLDDLQWADVASLEILEYLISDKHNHNSIMIIGSYRSNEVDETHIVTHTKRELNKKMANCQFHVTTVEVGNFFPLDVHKVIMKMLGIDDPTITKGLADICHKRTLGNPYFLVEFMTMLKDEGLLEYNLGLLKWVWDEKEIESATMSTDNVVHLLQSRMIKLKADELLTLQYAACLGASFDRSALELIWSSHSGISYSELQSAGVDVLGEMLLSLAQHKYIEALDEYSYRWVHDEVQEAALSLIGSAKPKFQFEIGCILYNALNEEELEESLFAIVDLINSMEIKRRPDFASLNLQAAEKAKEISAFSSAAMYVSHGAQCLPNDKWRSHRTLSLRLYTLGAEMELAIGNVDVMKEYYNEVMSQADCTIMEKLPLYITNLHKLSSIDLQYQESIDFNLKILKQFGCELIWKWNPQTIKAYAIQQVVQTRKMVSKHISRDFHQVQPMMDDPKSMAIMLLLSKLLYSCYVAHQQWISVLCATKMVRMTIKYGVHDASGSSFVAFSTLLREFYQAGNEASSLAETGLWLQNRVENHYTAAMTQYISQSFVFSWRKPLPTCLVPYLEGFVAGMRSGNIEFGLWCLVSHHIVIAYQLGKPLSLILARFPNCLHQMEDMKQQLQAYFVKVQWQMMINLQGEGAETVELKGEKFDMESLPPKTPMQESFTYFAQLELFMYYGEYEFAADLVREYGNAFERSSIGDSYSQTEAFHRSLALYAAGRKTKRRKFKKLAKKARATIEKWSKEGCPNVEHFLMLLKAEQAALDKKYEKAEELYKSAIIKAARPGRSHDAALFSERYADFLRQPIKYCQGLEEEAHYRIQEAIRYYTEWGALKKATMLQKSLELFESEYLRT